MATSIFLLPPTVVYKKELSKAASVPDADLIKVPALIFFDHSALCENSTFACVILEDKVPL